MLRASSRPAFLGALCALLACRPDAAEPPGAPRVDIGVVHVRATPTPRPEGPAAEAERDQLAPGAGETPPDAAPLRAGLTFAIPAGVLRAGSAPGTRGRDATAEADEVPVPLPAFTIDALPYPNDPDAAPRTGVSRDEAAALCDGEGKRLCDELEWERACEGPSGDALYGSGTTLDPAACAEEPARCRGPFGPAAMGTHLGEWTASPARRGLGSPLATAVFRGAAASGALPLHRCASRRAAAAGTRSPHLSFRCCGGPAPELPYPDERPLARFRVIDDAAEQRAVLAASASLPELSAFAEGLQRTSGDAAQAAVPDPTLLHGWELVASGVLRWAPVPGEEIWMLSARGTMASLIVALHRERDGGFSHGASFVLEGERAPIALAFTPPSPRELQWSAAWGRAGEGGLVRYEEGRVVITQR